MDKNFDDIMKETLERVAQLEKREEKRIKDEKKKQEKEKNNKIKELEEENKKLRAEINTIKIDRDLWRRMSENKLSFPQYSTLFHC